MTTASTRLAINPRTGWAELEPGPALRGMIMLVGVGFTSLCLIALTRAVAGAVPQHDSARSLAVMLHLAAVVPCVPLGAWLLLKRKGTPRHKALGKVWLVLMVLTALSAVFIRELNQGSFSPIHLFVPLTIWGAWQAIATARAGNIAKHRQGLIRLYLAALTIPGLFSFIPGRLMWAWLVG
ncbi:DUF2306 domain-containing protein [Novosphingobium sp. B 225]|uniref:DUF2306 domain-containing protein n=1 Tax=Novosphingobium sp. B 225 TaxID=1961849 RepID=UPI000B4B040C|nr:DUF2306 domain-containing protein [Novosphingobium sp. B 225]